MNLLCSPHFNQIQQEIAVEHSCLTLKVTSSISNSFLGVKRAGVKRYTVSVKIKEC